jgi:peptidoglycan-N-acetylglucosamine deacetylase
MKEYQVFSTMSPRRWRTVQVIGGVAISLMLIIGGTFAFTLKNHNKPDLPKNFSKNEQSMEQIAHDKTVSWASHAANGCCATPQPIVLTPLSNSAVLPNNEQVKAAFYVGWDQQSFFSLRKNISRINMVLPDWLFLGKNDSVICAIDTAAYKLLQTTKTVAVLPVLSNFHEGKWHIEETGILLNDAKKQRIFIESIIKTLKQYGFQGINLDFEELGNASIPNYYAFTDALYHRFQAEGLILAQTYVPYNEQLDVKKIYEHSNLVFVEALNQHYDTGQPEAIASLKWVEKWMQKLSNQVPNDKFILSMPTFGLNWGKKGEAQTEMTYRMALSVAEEAGAKVKFNPATYNLEYEYADENSVPHKVFFTDAVTTFNQLRTVSHFSWRGAAMHRLGSEDPRIWQFYDKDLSSDALAHGSFDINSLSKSIIPEDVEYVGTGEVMDVINENPTEGAIRFDYDKENNIISNEYYDKLPTSYVVQKYGKSEGKKLVLTFDDGPDKEFTPKILDILKEQNVPAAFFLVGKNIEANPELTKRIYAEGHELGNHTFYHPEIHRVWGWRAEWELIATRRSIESLTGHSTMLFRPPYNPYTEPQTVDQLSSFLLARHHNYLTVSESIDPLDWQKDIKSDEIFNRIVQKEKLGYGHIVLMHDAGGDRTETLKALPRVIQHFRDSGYQFVSIAELTGRSREDMMPTLNQQQQPLTKAYRAISNVTSSVNDTLKWVFYVAMICGTFRLFFILFFALKQYFKEKNQVLKEFSPPLSIIVPAYNEEVGAVSTIASLLNQNYPDFEVVFVDDGSKDRTYEVVYEAYKNDPRVQVLTKVNGGKASALNYGLQRCTNEFVVCIDADTLLDPNALYHLAKPFADPIVGAVAGNVKVGNEINLLTKWQSIEYITAQNFDRMAFAYLNCITVVPGCIGAFRRKAIGSAGWYETDTLAEDCDLTVRVIRKGYRVTHTNEALSITESPETYQQFLKQRLRWCFGVMQAFWKSKHVLFNRHYGTLGWVAFPNILFFGLLFPILAPIADLTLIGNLLLSAIQSLSLKGSQAGPSAESFYDKYHMLIMYMAFMMVDIGVSAVAFKIQKEPMGKLWLMFPQRFIYRPLAYYILFKSYMKAFKGELMGWGVLSRTGSMGKVTVKEKMPELQQVDLELEVSQTSVG